MKNVTGRSLTILLLCSGLVNLSFSQDLLKDINSVEQILVKTAKNDGHTKTLEKPKYRSELGFLMHGSISFYQNFISTQDNSYCNFTPSCSHYAQEAIKTKGSIKGIVLTSDRLQRCNGSAYFSSDYTFDRETGKFKDPIQKTCEKK